jgi:quercetin dioxygenase-like cupin family protein
MRVIEFTPERAQPIRQFESVAAASVPLGDGAGEVHAYCIYFDPGGEIGAHPAGFGQLFLVVAGSAWAAGADGRRVPLRAGQGAYFARGEMHSKGSDAGATVIMIQAGELNACVPEVSASFQM